MQIDNVPLDRILSRGKNQRTKVADVSELADSIKRLGLIHPIIIDDDFRLVAGENRLNAYRALQMLDIPHTGTWDTIPSVFKSNLSTLDKLLIELEENSKRTDISWQDHTIAIVEIDKLLQERFSNWTPKERADYLGSSMTQYHRWLKVGRCLIAKHERVSAAPNLVAALNIIERESVRTQDNVMNKLFDELTGVEEEKEAIPIPTKNPYGQPGTFGEAVRIKHSTKPERVIFQADFNTWIKTYSGARFNFLHCDFPYGINHGKSDQGGAKDRWESYEDSPDLYWQLIKTLCDNRDKILSPSAHIIFWFSMKLYGETIRAFNTWAPDLDIDYNPLIWHKTDNKGIIRNVQHTPRHVYETALFITRGNRQIIKAVGDAYGAPTGKSDAIHISEKPVPVLRHFFQLCIDGFSEVLDPTAGGGSAIRAASSMGAKRVLGLEINRDYADTAQREYEHAQAIESLSKVGAPDGQ